MLASTDSLSNMSYSIKNTREICEKVAKLSPCYNKVPSEDYYKGLAGYYAFIAHARTALPEANELLAECREHLRHSVAVCQCHAPGFVECEYCKVVKSLLERIGE